MSSHWKNLPSLFTRAYFTAKAVALKVFIDGIRLDTKPKVFSSGSLGWHLSAKKQVAIGDALVWCQINTTITVLGSKELPPEGLEVPRAESAA